MTGVPEIEGFVFRQQLTQSARCPLWRAEQTALERDVLVAVFEPEAMANPALGNALFAVARTMAQAKTALLPDVIDIIRTETQAYVILEDAHAQNVVQLLDGRRLTPAQALRLASRLAEGFVGLHAAHLVYGGLRPRSLYLVDGMEPLLPDFSPMRFEAGYGENPPVEPTGSAPYVAPEQYLEPAAVDTRADMFALGMTLYALTTGQVPFGALPPEEILQAKLTSAVPSPCDLVPNFPPALAGVLARLAQRDPQHRYTDWDEVLFDLHQAGEGIAPSGRNPSDSVIAPPDPAARARAERTIRLSVADLRRMRHERAFRERFSWLRLLGCLLVLSLFFTLLAGGLFWLFRELFLP